MLMLLRFFLMVVVVVIFRLLIRFVDFAKRNLDLFSRFIPNICARSAESDILIMAEESRRMQDELIMLHGFERFLVP